VPSASYSWRADDAACRCGARVFWLHDNLIEAPVPYWLGNFRHIRCAGVVHRECDVQRGLPPVAAVL
jgi:hypothetical protein